MFGNFSGRARTETEIADISFLYPTGAKGIAAVLGKTERGDKPRVVGSWGEYKKYFGGLLKDSDFPFYCKRALDGGARLLVGRVFHYSSGENPAIVGSASTGYFSVEDPKDEGGGLSVMGTNASFKAYSIGSWGNGLKIVSKPAENGVAHSFDLEVSLAGYPELTYTVKNMPSVLSIADINRFNREVLLVNMDASNATYSIIAGTVVFTGGAEDRSTVTTQDYVGDSSLSSGLHQFDNFNDFVRVCVPEMAIPEINAALSAYADSRKDCIAFQRAPIGVSGMVAIDYREGTGTYSHAPINSWRSALFYGSTQVIDPLSGGIKSISVIADVLAAASRRDNSTKEFYSFAGAERGVISNVIGFDYNLASRPSEFDQVDAKGINAVVSDPDFGAVIWGNNTLSRNNTLLKHLNVAELLIYMTRSLSPLVKFEFFNPNDIDTWKSIYRKIRPFMQGLVDARALWDFKFQGDQDIDDISQALVNTPEGIDNGEYHFLLWIKPKVALKYIGIKVIVTNSGVNFEEIGESTNV